MIYLDNITSPQNVWIPRNDGNGYVHTGSSQSYQEGYADGVNDQKAKLASTAFTENGEYQRNDGWSAITVNVPQSGSVLEGKEIVVSQDVTIVVPTSGYDGFSAVTIDATEYGQTNYDSGFDDGFEDGYASGSSEGYDSGYTDGYTSGETHQKGLLTSTAITQNGSYQRENGYSAITVNVPTGQTYNIEANHSFTATTNGNYTIKPSEIWSITYDDTFARRYDFTINGTIPQSFVNDTAYVVRYYDEITEEEPIVIIKVGSGNTLYLNKNGWDEDDYGDVYFRLYQGKYRLEFDNDDLDSSEFSIIPYSNGEKYDVMSAVTLNVNVPQTGHTDQEMDDAYDSGYTSGETVGENTIIATFSSMTATTNGVYGSSASPLSSITVNVPQTGHTDQEMDDAYDSGYTSGYTDGYDSGYTSGQTDGLNSGYTEGYNSGYTEGENDVISTFSSITITQNGQYGDSVHPMSSITVNVPQSGYSINDLALRNYIINNPSITASTIEESAFEGCSGLTGNLELGSSVWTIKQGAFCGSSISEIIWPQSIDGGAFSVTSMTMRDGCQFAECQNLVNVEVPSYVTFSSVTINASSGMFYNCQNLVNVDYYALRIPTRCFDGCIGLEYIYIDNITSIGQKAFYGCTHLTSIRFAQQNPPTVSNSGAFTYVPSGGTLYVPFGRSSAYQSYLNYLTNWTIVEDAE